jgi:hypothetical protein
MDDQNLVAAGTYEVTMEPIGRDRLRRRFRVLAASTEAAIDSAAESYLSDKRLRTYSNELRKTTADYFDRVDEVGSIASYEDWKNAAWNEAQFRTELAAGFGVRIVSVETLREPVFESVEEKNARSDRARQRALEARRRRNERSES